eukprot:CAMPEP_0170500366 /NCGR_PEP_ID=MMETSP0208-20121228/34573_1 /TAXON_ID=197538 /ORGANISM="Strombidium inclinatum, Strain S3" /LENGTH=150 /DNA_ID=CAMNT_0010778375 /DNA_START=1227 /DNA_END=1675 /DNA_ORIENTATION=-
MTMGLQFVTNNGWWWFNIFNWFAVGDCLIFVLVVETYCLVYYFGLDNLDALLFARTGERLPGWMKYCLKYVSIPIMTVLFVYAINQEFKGIYMEPAWTQWFGRCLLVAPMLIVGLGFIFPWKCTQAEQLIRSQYGKTLKELKADLAPGSV